MSKLFFNNNKVKNLELFDSWSFGKTNYILFFSGLFFILLGYFVMSLGSVNSFQSLTFAPILLFIGYIVLIPLSLLVKDKNRLNKL